MKQKRFINSKYYECKEVHNLNVFLDELPNATATKDAAEMIYALSKTPKPYDKVEDFVPNSTTHLQLLAAIKTYENANEDLIGKNFKREQILNEIYPEYLDLYKYSFDGMCIEYNYDTEQTESFITQYFFYVEEWKSNIIFNASDLKLSYIRSRDNQDLIEELLNQYDALVTERHCIRMCKQHNISFPIFEKVFNINDVTFYSSLIGNWNYLEYNGKKYYVSDVEALIEEREVAKTLKYIKGDTYIEFSNYMPFVDFKETAPYQEYLDRKNETELNGFESTLGQAE